jgi:late competence protein required for DNA uptake (superfamily II DNA/RNA helicase)
MDELREKLEREYAAAIAAAPTDSRKMACRTCGKVRMCKARQSGMPFYPIMWVCRECWSYATETHA